MARILDIQVTKTAEDYFVQNFPKKIFESEEFKTFIFLNTNGTIEHSSIKTSRGRTEFTVTILPERIDNLKNGLRKFLLKK